MDDGGTATRRTEERRDTCSTKEARSGHRLHRRNTAGVKNKPLHDAVGQDSHRVRKTCCLGEKNEKKKRIKKKIQKKKKKKRKRDEKSEKSKCEEAKSQQARPSQFPPSFLGERSQTDGKLPSFYMSDSQAGGASSTGHVRGAKKKKKEGNISGDAPIDASPLSFPFPWLAGWLAGRHGVSPFRPKGRPCKLSAAAGEDSDRPGQREEGPSDARTQAGGRAAVVQGHSAQEQSRAEHKTGLADRTDRQDRPTTLLLPHPACTRPDRRRSGDIDFSTSFNQTQTEARSPFCIRTRVRRPRYQPASAQHSTAQHTLRPTASQRDRERAGEEESKRRKQEKTHTVRRTSSAHKQPWVTKAPSPRATRGSPGRTQ